MMQRYLRQYCAACDRWWHRNKRTCPTCGGTVVPRQFPPPTADDPIAEGDALRPGRAAEW
jgi:hypothetical protein